jgi:NhaP-type Na+/H+ or K+/H+ antiporter
MTIKKNYSQEVLVIAVLLLTVTFVWVYLSVYRALNKSEKPIISAKGVRVLDPKLDSQVFEELRRRQN